jgi:hypothetical protein
MTLPLSKMKHPPISDIQDDFLFVVGGERYARPRIVAEFLSATISVITSVDYSTSEYIVGTEDLASQFQLFLSLWQGSTIRVGRSTCEFFLRLSSELGNLSLCQLVLVTFHGNFSVDQICDLCGDFSIGHIASQFHCLKTPKLETIPISMLSYFLSHPSLRISREDALCS